MLKFLYDVVGRKRFRQIVLKTDDELTRYKKQKLISARRKNFEE